LVDLLLWFHLKIRNRLDTCFLNWTRPGKSWPWCLERQSWPSSCSGILVIAKLLWLSDSVGRCVRIRYFLEYLTCPLLGVSGCKDGKSHHEVKETNN
jgi:hypothetical protein